MEREEEAPEEMLDEVAVKGGWSWSWNWTGNGRVGVFFVCLCDCTCFPACGDKYSTETEDIVVWRLRVEVIDELGYFKSGAQGFEQEYLEGGLCKNRAWFRWRRQFGTLTNLIIVDI